MPKAPKSYRKWREQAGAALLSLCLLAGTLPAGAKSASTFFPVSSLTAGSDVSGQEQESERDTSASASADSVDNSVAALQKIAANLIRWQRNRLDLPDEGPLLCDRFLALAGTSTGDWYSIGAARMGMIANPQDYLAVIRAVVEERYRADGGLSPDRATEWHRIAMAILSMGGDPTAVGTDEDGAVIHLIADGTYRSDDGNVVPIGRQGINSWIWGLIALDSLNYEIPEDAPITRDTILTEILRRQLPDGGFCFSGDWSDPDITAMALTALAPYYNDETIYTYTREADGVSCYSTIRQAADRALSLLSDLQTDTGEFASWGTCNVESACQVTIALCSMGIDPLTDPRFIKNGHTLLEVILRYRMPDGGFTHTVDNRRDDSGSATSDAVTGGQVLCALAALLRQSTGARRLYDFRAERGETLLGRISHLAAQIDALTDFIDLSDAISTPGKSSLQGGDVLGNTGEEMDIDTVIRSLLTDYFALPPDERSYVSNYRILSDIAHVRGIDPLSIAADTAVIPDPDARAPEATCMTFTEEDYAQVMALPEHPGSAYWVTVIRLWGKLEGAESPYEGELCRERLQAARQAIEAVLAEISALSEEIEALGPIGALTQKDRRSVEALVERYRALSDEDRRLVENGEQLLRAEATLRSQRRSLLIGGILVVAAALLIIYLLLRLRRRMTRQENSSDDHPESSSCSFSENDLGHDNHGKNDDTRNQP